MKTVLTLVVAYTILGPNLSFGADAKRLAGRLEIRHRDSVIVNDTYRKNNSGAKDEKLEAGTRNFTIHPNEQIELAVVDPNPFFYTYTWSDVAYSPSADYQEALKLAEGLKAFAASMPAISTANKEAVKSFFSLKGDPSDDVRAARSRAAMKLDLLNDAFYTKFAADLKTLSDAVGSIDNLIQMTADHKTVAAAKSEVAAWKVDGLRQGFEDAYKKIQDARTELIVALAKDPSLSGVSQAAINRLTLVADEKPSVDKMLALSAQFTVDMEAVNRKMSAKVPVTYDATQNGTVSLAISPVQSRAAAAKKLGLFTGDVKFVFEPYSPVHWSVRPAYVYTLVRENDTANSSWTGHEVAAMARLEFERFRQLPTAIAAQFGVNGKKDSVGIFGGLEVLALKAFRIGGGVVAKQVVRQGSVKFQPGGYFTISIDVD
jgi:hypothetical protein